tara:strand:- start:56 stop:406 length:351 start_codon:yes stop_codon:yes gene_type:complete
MNIKKTHCVYVIELDKEVLKKKKFMKENKNSYIDGKACFYVGMTFYTPEERFKHHKTRHKNAKGVDVSSQFPREYGKMIIKELCTPSKSLTYKEALKMEKEKALNLKNQGYGVYSR